MGLPATTMGTEVATMDMDFLSELSGAVNAEDVATANGPDVLKINYDEDSKHGRGVWVLGMKKNQEGKIINEGNVVDKIIILTTRYRWSYFDEKSGESVSTAMFKPGEQPPDKAEADRKVQKYPEGKLKFQIVVIGMAVVDGEFKEFISYLGGTAYGAMRDWLKELVVFNNVPIPPFAFVTELLEVTKKKYSTTTYFVPNFQRGVPITREQASFFIEAREKAYEFIDFMNERHLTEQGKSTTGDAAKPVSEMPKAGGMSEYKTTGDDVPDSIMKSTAPPTSSVPDEPEGYDIEAELLDLINNS